MYEDDIANEPFYDIDLDILLPISGHMARTEDDYTPAADKGRSGYRGGGRGGHNKGGDKSIRVRKNDKRKLIKEW